MIKAGEEDTKGVIFTAVETHTRLECKKYRQPSSIVAI